MRSSCHRRAVSPVAMADAQGSCQNFVGQHAAVSPFGQRVSRATRGEGLLQVMGG